MSIAVAAAILTLAVPSAVDPLEKCTRKEQPNGLIYVCPDLLASISDQRVPPPGPASKVEKDLLGLWVIDHPRMKLTAALLSLRKAVQDSHPGLVLKEVRTSDTQCFVEGMEGVDGKERRFAGSISLMPAPGGADQLRTVSCVRATAATDAPTCEDVGSLLAKRPSYLLAPVSKATIESTFARRTDCKARGVAYLDCAEGTLSVRESTDAATRGRKRTASAFDAAESVKRSEGPCRVFGAPGWCLHNELTPKKDATKRLIPFDGVAPGDSVEITSAYTLTGAKDVVVLCMSRLTTKDGKRESLCSLALGPADPGK